MTNLFWELEIDRKFIRKMWIAGLAAVMFLGCASGPKPSNDLFNATSSTPPGLSFLRTDGGAFRDEARREVVLHGINVECKDPRLNFLGPEDAAVFVRMREWGFTAVRFAIFWQAVEPAPGEYNGAYLAEVDRRIAWARDPNQAFAPHAYDLVTDTAAYAEVSTARMGFIFGSLGIGVASHP